MNFHNPFEALDLLFTGLSVLPGLRTISMENEKARLDALYAELRDVKSGQPSFTRRATANEIVRQINEIKQRSGL